MNWEAEAADITGLSRDFLNNKIEKELSGRVTGAVMVMVYLVLAHWGPLVGRRPPEL